MYSRCKVIRLEKTISNCVPAGGSSPNYCGPPPLIENAGHDGALDQTFYDLDTELSYHCDPGYVRHHHKEPLPALPPLISHFILN